MNCRGHETRQRIVRDYEVQPKAHIKLLANQQKHSDAGAIIEDEYYIFSSNHKTICNKEFIQFVMGAARDFLVLINHEGLPLFNPLMGEPDVNKRQEYNNKGSGNLQPKKWNKTAKQLYNAIMWLIILWDAKPDTPLFDFKDEVIKYKTYEPFESKIKRVNTTIKNGSKGKTLTEMIDGYRADNDIRVGIYNFDILKNKIRDMKDQQGNTIESYF